MAHRHNFTQHQRRRLILATARRLIAESGGATLPLQRLAQECDTSRQNIHNMIGGKRDIIWASLIEFNEQVLSCIPKTNDIGNLYPSFLRTYKMVAEIYPEYISAAERIMFSDHELYRKLIKKSAQHFLPVVKSLLGASDFRKEHWQVSYQLLSVPHNAVRDWIEGACTIDEMFDDWIFGTDVVISGALSKFGGVSN